MRKNKSKLNLKKFQIAKINHVNKIFGGNDSEDCGLPTATDTKTDTDPPVLTDTGDQGGNTFSGNPTCTFRPTQDPKQTT